MKKFLLFICSFLFTMSSYSQNEGEKLQIYPISENMAIIFVSPEKSFIELGVKEEEVVRYIKDISDVFEKHVINKSKSAKLAYLVSVSNIKESKKPNCQKDFRKCIITKIAIEGNVDEKELENDKENIIIQDFLKIDEMQVRNFKSKSTASFIILLENKINKNNFI